MKFERLRLAGFKSFCDPTEFKIEPGSDRSRRPQRLRQVEPRRGLALGDGRKLVQEHARRGDGRSDLLRRRRAAVAQSRRGRPDARQFRSPRARRLQRFRDDRSHAPHRARVGLDLSRQRPRGARARRAAAVRRRLHRRALAGVGAPGPDRRDHRRQAAGAAADPRGGGRRLRPAFAPPRGRAAGSRGPRTISSGSRTSSSRSTRRSTASSARRARRIAIAIWRRTSAATRRWRG